MVVNKEKIYFDFVLMLLVVWIEVCGEEFFLLGKDNFILLKGSKLFLMLKKLKLMLKF